MNEWGEGGRRGGWCRGDWKFRKFILHVEDRGGNFTLNSSSLGLNTTVSSQRLSFPRCNLLGLSVSSRTNPVGTQVIHHNKHLIPRNVVKCFIKQ